MIARVILWSNGLVMVFDDAGQQVPEYQGRFEDVVQRIYAVAPEAAWQVGHWPEPAWLSEPFALGWEPYSGVPGPPPCAAEEQP